MPLDNEHIPSVSAVSRVLIHDQNPEAVSVIKEFCRENQLVRLKGRSADILEEYIKKNIGLGAIFLSEDRDSNGNEGIALAAQLHRLRPEVPIFLRTNAVSTLEDLPVEVQHCFAGLYHLGDLSSLKEQIQKHIFNLEYPNHLLQAIQKLTIGAISSQLAAGVVVTCESPYLVNDLLIHGDVISLIPLESNWVKGYMMLQMGQDDMEQMFAHQMTLLPRRKREDFRDLNDWLSETTNEIWGQMKARILSLGDSGKENSQVEIPIVSNLRERYITFGGSDPQLVIKYIISDPDKDVDEIIIFQKIIANIRWIPSAIADEEVLEEDTDDDGLEFF